MTAPDTMLTIALRRALDSGEVPPCCGPYFDAWTSDDIADRAAAAEMCEGCPITAACAAAADLHDERFGVWAGLDRSGRRTAGEA